MWGAHSSLDAAGAQASHIAGVWWMFLAVTAVVYVAVMVTLILALTRRVNGARDEHRRKTVVMVATAVTSFLLLVMLAESVLASHALDGLNAEPQISVHVVARQWWWEFQYEADPVSQMVTTANELHVPVGKTVSLKLDSRDVIHSFWVPALDGKHDLIPGRTRVTTILAERPGVYRGQCAEFCGDQHTHMGLIVIAESPDEFERWLHHQRSAAATPVEERARHGREVFLRGPCVLCHTVAGTSAAASAGPDLSHMADRMTLAAGTLSNTREHLAGWIQGSQTIKPGNHMPNIALPAEELDALLSYLETLK
jgi:cytochrome c oxidase subunit 2